MKDAQTPAIRTLNADGLSRPGGHYSHVCIFNGLAFIAGQLPIDASGRPVTEKSFKEQTQQVLANLDACLSQAGIDRAAILHVRVFITDMKLLGEFDGIYSGWIGEHRPARLVAGVNELHFGALLEMEVVAAAA